MLKATNLLSRPPQKFLYISNSICLHTCPYKHLFSSTFPRRYSASRHLYIGVHSAQTSDFFSSSPCSYFNSYHYTLYTSLFSGRGAGWHLGDPENHIPMIHLPLTRNSLYLLSSFQIFILIASPFFFLQFYGVTHSTQGFPCRFFVEGARSLSRAQGFAL
jgi:hypothetical protein